MCEKAHLVEPVGVGGERREEAGSVGIRSAGVQKPHVVPVARPGNSMRNGRWSRGGALDLLLLSGRSRQRSPTMWRLHLRALHLDISARGTAGVVALRTLLGTGTVADCFVREWLAFQPAGSSLSVSCSLSYAAELPG